MLYILLNCSVLTIACRRNKERCRSMLILTRNFTNARCRGNRFCLFIYRPDTFENHIEDWDWHFEMGSETNNELENSRTKLPINAQKSFVPLFEQAATYRNFFETFYERSFSRLITSDCPPPLLTLSSGFGNPRHLASPSFFPFLQDPPSQFLRLLSPALHPAATGFGASWLNLLTHRSICQHKLTANLPLLKASENRFRPQFIGTIVCRRSRLEIGKHADRN